MKKIFYLFGLLSFGLFSCQEVNDLVQLAPPAGANDQLTIDTTKYSAVAAQPKNVLIEDFTGVHCDNCPDAQAKAIAIENANPGRVSVIGIHCTDAFGFPFPGHPDYRTINGTNLVSYLIGTPGSLPTGDIDRTIIPFYTPASILVPYSTWPGYVDSFLKYKTPKAAIAFNNKTYNAGSRTLSIDITTTFPLASTDTFYVSAALIEGGFADWQQTHNSVNKNFVFEHVLRKLMLPYNGLNIANSAKAGTTVSAKFTTILAPSWNVDSCKIVAFVHHRSTTSNAVEQVQQTTVK